MQAQSLYPHKSIQSIEALSRALRVPQKQLEAVAEKADELYRLAKAITKPDGSTRLTYDALPSLKSIHRKIQTQILGRVNYASYLTGSLPGQSPKKNAELHLNPALVICEDIASFFPSTSASVVFNIWRHFFGFSQSVAELLTRLTTKNGALPQGAITSSYLANLAFWDVEPNVVARFAASGVRYSRYVDDITLSSKSALATNETTAAIGLVYGTLARKGYRAKRSKHEVARGNGPMTTTKLGVSVKVGLPKAERARIRTRVYQLEAQVKQGQRGNDIITALKSAESHVGRLGTLHAGKARTLKARLSAIRIELLQNSSAPAVTSCDAQAAHTAQY